MKKNRLLRDEVPVEKGQAPKTETKKKKKKVTKEIEGSKPETEGGLSNDNNSTGA